MEPYSLFPAEYQLLNQEDNFTPMCSTLHNSLLQNETEEQRWRVEEKKPIRLGAIGILEGKTPSLNTSVTIFF